MYVYVLYSAFLEFMVRAFQFFKLPISLLKSDLNEVLFVLELGELLGENIRITTTWIFKKIPTHKNIYMIIDRSP